MSAAQARELCEQLRLVLEPTLASKLKGDFKSGKRSVPLAIKATLTRISLAATTEEEALITANKALFANGLVRSRA